MENKKKTVQEIDQLINFIREYLLVVKKTKSQKIIPKEKIQNYQSLAKIATRAKKRILKDNFNQQKSYTDDPPKTHKTKEGDTYSKLSKRYGVSVKELRKWNGYPDKQIPIDAKVLLQDPTTIPLEELEQELKEKYNAWEQSKSKGKVNIPTPSPRKKDKELTFEEERNDAIFGSSLGSSIQTFKDIKQRNIYIEKTAANAQKFLDKFEQQVKDDYKKAKNIAIEASKTRNANRSKFQKNPKLSYGAKEVSKALDQDRSLASLVRKYGIGSESNLSGEALRKHLIKKSGNTNPSLMKFNTFSKGLGVLGLAGGLVISAVEIYSKPSFETVLGEVGAWIGGAIGTSLGVGLAAAGIAALGGGVALVLMGALAAGIGIGYVVGYITHKVGSWLGSLIDSIL